MKRSEYLPYLRTLRRVPDDVILAVATREMDMSSGATCLCGWFVKEQIARLRNIAPEGVDPYDDIYGGDGFSCPNEKAATFFGGTQTEWDSLYSDADRAPKPVERAFVERIMEAVA